MTRFMITLEDGVELVWHAMEEIWLVERYTLKEFLNEGN